MEERGVTIYILELEGGKYYVGKTTRELESRVLEHFEGDGSAWTHLYPPKRVIKMIQNCSPFDEDKHTKECMANYGINNVRGGTYCRVNLTDEEEKVLTREIRGAEDRCLRCGRESHFASDCYAKTNVEDGEGIQDSPAKEPVLGKRKDPPLKKEKKEEKGTLYQKQSPPIKRAKGSDTGPDHCYRCGRGGHWAEDCYAKTDIDGRPLYEDSPLATYNRREVRRPLSSSQKQNSREALKGSKEKEASCYRCGRPGHLAEACYAKTDIDGNRLKAVGESKQSVGSFWDIALQVLSAVGQALTQNNDKTDCCYRCGRPGHWAEDCYAKTNVHGERLD